MKTPGLPPVVLVFALSANLVRAEAPATLKDVYKDAFLLGCSVNDAIVSGADGTSQEIVLQQFNTITLENSMKAEAVNPLPDVYRFRAADAFVAFGETNNLFIVGHTLVWHNQTPAWFFQDESGNPNTPEAQIERMRRHIQAVAGRYAGRVDAWDVVNEVIDNDGSYRSTAWVQRVGSGNDLVKAAFRFAAEYAPDAELYYNDFNAWRPAKRDGIVRMVQMLQAEGIRIDGIGIQGHWGLNYPKTEYIEAAIDAYAALGVKVMITELDVDVLPLTREGQIIGQGMSDSQFQLEEFKEYLDPYRGGLPAAVESRLADRYAELFGIFHRKRDKISRVTLWGLHDGMSWKNGYPVPNRTNYPLLFDRNRRPKPALDAVLKVPAAEPDHSRAEPMKPWERGAWETGRYRNVFLDAGYKQEEIDAKLAKAYHDLFEGPNRVYFEVGDDMAYVTDIKNRDARTEGLSYGMMVAVQLDKKEIFDRLWRWTRTYMQHQDGPREAYFAWSVNPQTNRQNSPGSASDGELYFITSLLFASNRWGNDAGIDYGAEARRILDAMWAKDGTDGIRNIINVEHKMINFVPEGRGYNWTDPSYHVPAFFEVWAEYAGDGREDFYRECAAISRDFLHKACHPVTGLTPDYAEFDGSPHRGRMEAFGFDSWRVPMNIAMDYSWYAKDKEWQTDYANRLHDFLYARGVDKFEDQFNPDGTPRERLMSAGGYTALRHSLGWVATTAAASLMSSQEKGWEFVDEIWNAKLEPYGDGYFDPYYDGLLYLFSLMHLSGNYQIIRPAR
jgi:oligosaccharide reducing-end xylanase